jgi:hypothetical protein
MSFARFTSALILFALVFSGGAYAREMESFPVVKLQSLDKITARTMTFEATVGNTVKFGSLYIKIQACKKAPPIEQPEAAAFLQIWEVKPQKIEDKDLAARTKPKDEAQWVFSGWMFSSSPALSHMDHPVYDVWVLDCLAAKGQKKAEPKPADAEPGEGEIEAGKAPQQPAIETHEVAPAPDATPATDAVPEPGQENTAPLTAPETAPPATPDVAPTPTPAPTPITPAPAPETAPDANSSNEMSPLGD